MPYLSIIYPFFWQCEHYIILFSAPFIGSYCVSFIAVVWKYQKTMIIKLYLYRTNKSKFQENKVAVLNFIQIIIIKSEKLFLRLSFEPSLL